MVGLVMAIGACLSVAMLPVTLVAIRIGPGLFTRDAAIARAVARLVAPMCVSVCVFPVLLSSEGSLLAAGQVTSLAYAMLCNVAFMALGWAAIVSRGVMTLGGVWWVFSAMHCFYTAVMLALLARSTQQKKRGVQVGGWRGGG